MKFQLSKTRQQQFNSIVDYYSWLTFKPNKKMSCPSWDIYEGEKMLGTIFYFGDWRIESDPETGWGDDFESFICDIDDFEEY